jgi:hypothetical protein
VINRALGVARDVLDGIDRVPEHQPRSMSVKVLDSLPPTTQPSIQRAPGPDLGLGL